MTKVQKLTKRVCDTALEAVAAGRDQVLWDAGDGSVKGFGLRVTAKGARSFILMYRAGRGRAAPLRKVTIGPYGSPWTVETARKEALRLRGEVADDGDPAAARARERAAKRGVERRGQGHGARGGRGVAAARPGEEPDPGRGAAHHGEAGAARLGRARPAGRSRKRDVIELIDGIADRGARTAANRALAYVKRFFNWCAGRDMVDANPAQYVEKPAEEVRRDRVLDDAELVEVWRAVEGMALPFAAGVRLLILTGARRSEIFEATRDELKAAALHLPAARVKSERGPLVRCPPLPSP